MKKGSILFRESPSQPATAWHTHALLLLALFALTLLAYANSFRCGFPLDNRFLILEDPRLTAPTAENLSLILTQDYCYPQVVGGVYRPVTTLTYLFNYSILGSGKNPASYHWINMALHWLSIVLVYVVVLRVLRGTAPAFAVTAVWALHPTSTECVTNIIGRANLIAASTVFAGLLSHLKSTSAATWRKTPWLLALMVITTLGLFSKESAIVVLAVMAIYDVTFWKEAGWLERAPGYVALAPPLLLFWYVRAHLYPKLPIAQMPFVDNPMLGADFWTARLTAVKVIGKYLWLLVFPRDLSCDYSYNQIPVVTWRFDNWEEWKTLGALVVCALAVLIAIRCHRRCKPVFFFVAFFFATLSPTSNLVMLIGPDMAERFLYLPAIGFIGCLVVALDAAQRRASARYPRLRWLVPTALALVCLAFGVRTYVRNFDWMDDRALWASAVKVCPNSFKTHRSLAYALNEQYPKGEKLETCIAEVEQSLKIVEGLPDAQNTAVTYSHAGVYYRLEGDKLAVKRGDGTLVASEESMRWYQKALKTLLDGARVDQAYNQEHRRNEILRGKRASDIPNDGWADLYENLGIVYMRLLDPRQALVALKYGLTLRSADPHLYQDIAAAYSLLGDNRQAAITLIADLVVNPNDAESSAWLANLYPQMDPEGCAITNADGKPRLNWSCPLVHEHACSAYESLVRLGIEIKQERVADQLKTTAVTKMGCAAEPFDQILPERPLF